MSETVVAPPPMIDHAPVTVAEATCLTWTVHPARRSLSQSVLVFGVVVAAGCMVMALTGSAAFGLLAVSLLVISLRHFFLPTKYVIDGEGVAVRCLGIETRRPWNRLRRFRYDAQGAFLSTRVKPGAVDSFTGLHLTWNGNADEAIRVITGFLADRISETCPSPPDSDRGRQS